MNGSLTYQDYINLITKNIIKGSTNIQNQIQPSSIDLTLSDECYEIKSSFLSPNNRIRNILSKMITKKIDLSKNTIFYKNKTYLVRLNETLNLKNNIKGLCNPKSSTGRLDIFCRTILDYSDEYEKVPNNYNGEIFLEITSQSFAIQFHAGDSLNQMRLVYKENIFINDVDLKNYNKQSPILFDNNNKKIVPSFNNGLKISVDLSNKNKINAYIAKKNAPILIFSKVTD